MVINPKKAIKTIKEIPLKSKHIRWNYEKSEDNFHMNIPLTRLYFAIIDNREAHRKEISNKLIDKITKTGSSVMQVEKPFNLEVKNSDWGLLFVTYDSLVNPETLNLETLGVTVKRDYKMCKKDVLNIEDYLTRIYE